MADVRTRREREEAVVRRLLASEGAQVLQIRNYRLFFVGQSVSLIGTWMIEIATAWLVLRLTADPLWLGVVTAVKYIPVVAFSMIAGVAADALSKRRILTIVQVVVLLISLSYALVVIAGVVDLWMILLFTFALGVTSAVEWPVRQAFAVEVVGRENVSAAVALNATMFNGARVLGPAAAGIAIGVGSEGFALVLGALSYLAAILGLWAMDGADLHLGASIDRPESARDVGRSLLEGLRYIRSSSVVLASVAVVCAVATVGMNFSVLIPAFVSTDLGAGAETYGFLMAAAGVGSLAAAARLIFGGRPRPMRLATGALMLGVSSVGLALTRNIPIALCLMVAVGFGSILMSATGNATIQLAVPDHLRGRVVSAYMATFAASVPIGGLVMGAVASEFGPGAAIALGGVLTVGIAVAAWAWGERIALDTWTPDEFDPDQSIPSVAPRS